tara:strand:+ start:1198 stop:1932 length:735 start_codon:yes stop_codon:yes gene_type:complete
MVNLPLKIYYLALLAILSIGVVSGDEGKPSKNLEVTKELLTEINSYRLKKPIFRTKSEAKKLLESVIERIKPQAEAICRELSSSACEWELEVVSGNAFNAYASGTNKISFYTGLVRGVYYEEELAFVVAHEIGHHIGNHISKSKTSTILGALIGAALAIESDNPTIAADAANIGAYIGRFSFSRKQEIEADSISKIILLNSGYDMEKARAGLIRLTRTGLSPATSSFLDSHPSGPERVLIFDNL